MGLTVESDRYSCWVLCQDLALEMPTWDRQAGLLSSYSPSSFGFQATPHQCSLACQSPGLAPAECSVPHFLACCVQRLR